jgi:hypothetical protein
MITMTDVTYKRNRERAQDAAATTVRPTRITPGVYVYRDCRIDRIDPAGPFYPWIVTYPDGSTSDAPLLRDALRHVDAHRGAHMALTPSGRLTERLRAMGLPVPPNANIERVRAGWADRAAGAWSWRTFPPTPAGEVVGSQFRVADLLKARRLVAVNARGDAAGEWSVFPADGDDDLHWGERRILEA